MKIIALFILLCPFLILDAQKGAKSQSEKLNETKPGIESETKIKSDSLKILNQKTELLKQEELPVIKKTKGDQNNQKKERRKELIKKYGKEIGEKIYSHEYWIGMSTDKALESLGDPETIRKNVGSWGVNEEWVYYNLYLYFENGILTRFRNRDDKLK